MTSITFIFCFKVFLLRFSYVELFRTCYGKIAGPQWSHILFLLLLILFICWCLRIWVSGDDWSRCWLSVCLCWVGVCSLVYVSYLYFHRVWWLCVACFIDFLGWCIHRECQLILEAWILSQGVDGCQEWLTCEFHRRHGQGGMDATAGDLLKC